MANPDFVLKIKAKMAEQNLGIRDLARKLSVSHPTVTELVTYGKKPSFDTCVALSKWLGQKPGFILEEAGLLPANLDKDPLLEQIDHVYQNLKDPVNKQSAVKYLEYLLEQEQKGTNTDARQNPQLKPR